jgi:hypothetical protein
MKTIEQLLSNYLHERREIITGVLRRWAFLVFVVVGILPTAGVFVFLGYDVNHVKPIAFTFPGAIGYFVWIVFFRKAAK